MNLLYINWNPDPVCLFLGNFGLRWYSIFWIIALLSGSMVVYQLFKYRRYPTEHFDLLFTYCFIGILCGARLGHCFFYDPGYFLNHPLEIVLPVHFLPNGDWIFTGYTGLASHGGTLGLIIALFFFCRKTRMHYLDILDMMGIAAPLAAGFIRLANLMNSEIIGKPTEVPWAFVFERVDSLPRHPAQLYEALAYFLFFAIMVVMVLCKRERYKRGSYFGWCLIMIFSFRFLVEFLKENQVDFENSLTLNMGQLLSLPYVLLGLFFILRPIHFQKTK